jgi:tetratricopeptide (TPR) repeat protein
VARTALPRQQTLRATLDWSYELLSGHERVVLRRLAVFAGGCTLEAAEAVCSDPSSSAAPTGEVAKEAVLDLLAGLVAKSLVLLDDHDARSRYRLLETVRQYGQEQLAAAGELTTVRDRHLDWCIALGEQATPHFRGAEQLVWLDRLETEHDNLRSALRWSMEAIGGVAMSMALAGAIWPLWALRGHLREGQRWFDEILARPGSVPAAGRVRALYGAQSLALHLGDHARVEALAAQGMALARQIGDSAATAGFLTNLARGQSDVERGRALGEEGLAQAREAEVPGAIAAALQQLGNALIGACDLAGAQAYLEESAVLYRGLGDRVGLTDALTDLGQVAADRGHYERADDLHSGCLSIQCSLGHQLGIAVTLNCMGHVAYCRGDMARAAAMLEESIRLSRKLGNREHLAQALACRARVARHESDSEQATALLEEALALSREMGDDLGTPARLTELGRVAHAQGDLARAASLHRQALTLAQEIHIILDVADCLEALAATLAAQMRWELAARLFGAASSHREATRMPMPPPDRAAYDRSVSAIRVALGEAEWAAARAAGRATPLEAAISQALEDSAVEYFQPVD